MVDNPLFVLLVAVVLFIVLLAIFTLATYLFLKMAVKLKRIEKKLK